MIQAVALGKFEISCFPCIYLDHVSLIDSAVKRTTAPAHALAPVHLLRYPPSTDREQCCTRRQDIEHKLTLQNMPPHAQRKNAGEQAGRKSPDSTDQSLRYAH